MLEKFCKRPDGLTEIRRDGKDNDAIINMIKDEYKMCEEKALTMKEISNHMEIFTSACWVSILVENPYK